MAIEFVAATATPGATASVIVPARLAGDLIVIFALRTSSQLDLGTPSGYTSLYEGTSARLIYRFAPSDGGESTVTVSNAQRSVTAIYRGVNTDTPFQNVSGAGRLARTVFSIGSMPGTDPAMAKVVSMFASGGTTSILSDPPFAGFTTRAYDVSGWAGDLDASEFAGASSDTFTSTICAHSRFGLVPAEGDAPERQRSRLILTPW